MPQDSSKNKGCGCFFPLLMMVGGAYGWFIHLGNPVPTPEDMLQVWQQGQVWLGKGESEDAESVDAESVDAEFQSPSRASSPPVLEGEDRSNLQHGEDASSRQPVKGSGSASEQSPDQRQQVGNENISRTQAAWRTKEVRGIYLSRYQVTNNASESTIRDRVRYYKRQGFNTILHGVWGNGCTMYRSQVMQQQLGMPSCPNLFQDRWLDWLMDEAHQQGMEVHAYFEKGIKLDKNSPIFDRAVREQWLVPGVDKTYAAIDHYVLDVRVPAVKQLFTAIAAEFVQKYPKVDAVQWDDYVGYHAELPVKGDKTAALTAFMTEMIKRVKAVNPNVSFDVCHHNPYWSKRYFAADWENWGVDRAYIQVYNDGNFEAEMDYVRQYDGAAITNNQLHRLQPLIADPQVKGILVFPNSGKPQETAMQVRQTIEQAE